MPAYTQFEQVWRKIGGDGKSTMTEVLEALRDEISSRESIASKLFRAKDFQAHAGVEQERNSFVQVQYGIQDMTYLDNGNESDIWKAARAKRPEILERDKEARASWKANAEAWSKLIDEHRSEIGDAISKTSSQAREGVPGQYEAVVQLGGQPLIVYKKTRASEEQDIEKLSSSDVEKYIDAWKDRFLETAEAKKTAPQKEEKEKSPAVGQNVAFCLKTGGAEIKGRVAEINEKFVMLRVGKQKLSLARNKGDIKILPEKLKEALPKKSRAKDSPERSFSIVD
jgi:hypothetical protein